MKHKFQNFILILISTFFIFSLLRPVYAVDCSKKENLNAEELKTCEEEEKDNTIITILLFVVAFSMISTPFITIKFMKKFKEIGDEGEKNKT